MLKEHLYLLSAPADAKEDLPLLQELASYFLNSDPEAAKTRKFYADTYAKGLVTAVSLL